MIVTLGVEEELQVVDAGTGVLAAHDIAPVKLSLAEGKGGLTSEIHKCTIELQTPVCTGPDAAVASLSGWRGVVREELAQKGQTVIAAGLHPFSMWQSQPLHDDKDRYPHYAHLLDEYGEIARSAMSFGLHIHLGLPDPVHRMAVMNALRSVLPEVLALSANSPFHEGRDTGLATWRHSVLGRYPRMGVPDIWPDEASYWAHIEKLRRVGSIEPDHAMWDDLRIHQRYGTLEVRICDAVYSLERIWLIAALLQCEALTLAEEARAGTLPRPEPSAWIEENRWRARRRGLNASFVDWTRDETVPAATRFERWLARVLPAAMKLGLWPRIELSVATALAEGTGADRQRQWLNEGGSFGSLVDRLAEATAVPWAAPTSSRRIDANVAQPAARPTRRSRSASSPGVRTG